MRISVIGGTGYVGLVTGIGMAVCGNDVICADINEQKIEGLNRDILPIYEKGLPELLKKAKEDKRIVFTSNVGKAVAESDIIFIAVGTPENRYGDTDLSQLVKAVRSIAGHMTEYKIIVVKSTVPVGTCELAARLLNDNLRHPSVRFDVVSNPEFLREGNAVWDFMTPERIVIGSDSTGAAEKIRELYAGFDVPVIMTDTRSSEMIKYACNSYLASRISFINEIAEICEKTGADIKPVVQAMKLDRRIGGEYLDPGPGFGGPCLSKDLNSLINFAERADANVGMLKAAAFRNGLQIDNIMDHIFKEIERASKGKVTVLGLSFKPGTDDLRNSPAVHLLDKLAGAGITAVAYDPVVKKLDSRFDHCVVLAGSIEEAACNSDCLVLMTDWQEFRELNLEKIRDIMRTPSIVDARNMISADTACCYGFRYKGVGTRNNVLLEQVSHAGLRDIV